MLALKGASARKRAQLTADLSGAVANKEIIWAELQLRTLINGAASKLIERKYMSALMHAHA